MTERRENIGTVTATKYSDGTFSVPLLDGTNYITDDARDAFDKAWDEYSQFTFDYRIKQEVKDD